MRNRGAPYHQDAETALQIAVGRVNGFKGHPALLPEPLLFTQQVVLDSLALAPSPIGDSWLAATLSSISAIARWAHNTGQPLTRDHVLSEETRYRYNQTRTDMSEGGRNLYWTRVELIADFLNGTTPGRTLRKPTITEEAPLEPLSEVDEADLWIWACGVRPLTRRHRVKGMLALALGCGLNGGEIVPLTTEHVLIDADGVHVRVYSKKTGHTRLVTCRADWEDRLAAIVSETAPGHYLTAPWRNTLPSHSAACESLRRAMVKDPPVLFNVTRLRNTWLCRHLAAGTPLKVLMEAADMKEANHLHNLLAIMPPTNAADAKRALRGTRVGSHG